jgi:hypothetical protein
VPISGLQEWSMRKTSDMGDERAELIEQIALCRRLAEESNERMVVEALLALVADMERKLNSLPKE